MGIRVRHSPPIKNVGDLANIIGQAQRKDIDRKFDQQDRQLDQRDEQLAIQRMQLARQMDIARLRADTQRQLQDSSQNSMLERMRLGNALSKDQSEHSQGLKKSLIQWQYSEQQRQEIDKIGRGLNWLNQQLQDGYIGEPEYRRAVQQLEMKASGIAPMPGIGQPTAQEAFEESSWYDEKTGQTLYQNPRTGAIEPLKPSSEMDFEIYSGFVTDALKIVASTTLPGKSINMDEVLSIADKTYEHFFKEPESQEVTENPAAKTSEEGQGQYMLGMEKQVQSMQEVPSFIKSIKSDPDDFLNQVSQYHSKDTVKQIKKIIKDGDNKKILAMLYRLGVI